MAHTPELPSSTSSMRTSSVRPRPLIIAHRGASGYLPEHTLAAAALAHGQSADVIEQDVVLSNDGQLVVLHDIFLELVTDVAEQFPRRHRDDGRYYVIDFTLDELRRLRVHERRDEQGHPALPGRFPQGRSRFNIATLDEHIELIEGLNHSTGRCVGLCVEIKRPAWHLAQGYDVALASLEALSRYGYLTRRDAAYVECFDPNVLQRMRNELATDLRLVQLIGGIGWNDADVDFAAMTTDAGLASIATYADAIGPWTPWVGEGVDPQGRLASTGLVDRAHRHGLAVFTFTLRADALPPHVDSYPRWVHALANEGVDGLFVDFPDRTFNLIAAPLREST